MINIVDKNEIKKIRKEWEEREKRRREGRINNLLSSHKLIFALEIFAIDEHIIPEDFYLLLKDRAGLEQNIGNLTRFFKYKKRQGEFDGTFENFLKEKERERDNDALEIKKFIDSNLHILEGYKILPILNLYNVYSQSFWKNNLLPDMKKIIGSAIGYRSLAEVYEGEDKVNVIFCRKANCTELNECISGIKKDGYPFCPGYKEEFKTRNISKDEIEKRHDHVKPQILKSPEFFDLIPPKWENLF